MVEDVMERRSHPTMADRLGRIEHDLGTLKRSADAFFAAQGELNREFQDHLIHSRDLGEVHEDKYGEVMRIQQIHEARLRSMEDWRVELRTYGTILKLTFGVSIIGAIVSLITLLDVAGRITR